MLCQIGNRAGLIATNRFERGISRCSLSGHSDKNASEPSPAPAGSTQPVQVPASCNCFSKSNSNALGAIGVMPKPSPIFQLRLQDFQRACSDSDRCVRIIKRCRVDNIVGAGGSASYE